MRGVIGKSSIVRKGMIKIKVHSWVPRHKIHQVMSEKQNLSATVSRRLLSGKITPKQASEIRAFIHNAIVESIEIKKAGKGEVEIPTWDQIKKVFPYLDR